ncbi:MAG TPA: ATP-binding protein [Gemmatimonadaceae bacterium]|nr:ATP-binding protein [Gemmatimonadaceae bacterium]
MRIFEQLQPIRRKLPVLISGLLLVAMAAYSWSAYRQIERILIAAAGSRSIGVAQRLAALLDESARRVRTESRALAADSIVQRVLLRSDSASRSAARVFLESRRGPTTPQLTSIALFTTSHERVVSVGDAHISPGDIDTLLRAAAGQRPGSAVVSPLRAAGDTIYYQVLVPVVQTNGDTLGFVMESRSSRSGKAGEAGAEVIRQLIGRDAAFLVGDTATRLWTDLAKLVPGPALPLRTGALVQYTDTAGRAFLGAAARIPSTPWMVWVQFSRASVLAPARDFLLRTGTTALIIIVLGTLGAWILTRHITAPLTEMTRAAEAIAAGDYSRRVSVGRSDELGQLSASFNSMAVQMGESTHALEARVADRTRELQQALAELESAQDTLVRRERLAILGQLAGGVGHELRNPLGVMTNALYYLDATLRDTPPDVQEYLGILKTQVTLSEKIVGDLLDYARVKQPRRERIALGELTAEQIARVGPPAGVRVDADLPADLPPVLADRAQIGQVLLNLVTNAVQAMDGSGGVNTAEGTLTVRACSADGTVRLDISDTGTGIAPENMAKIFEPLFTTKPRGIGLGLAVSRSLARANGGDIDVSSHLGAGATFSLVLPRMAEPEGSS